MTRNAKDLLISSFTINGQIIGSAVDTCEGTQQNWNELNRAGFVDRNPRSPLGHPFSYRLTDMGRDYLNSLWDPYNHPFFCKTCRNTFNTLENLIAHRQRKHSHIVPVYPLW